MHGDADDVVPLSHMERLARIARASRAGRRDAQRVDSVVVHGARHSWLYEFPVYRETVARFLAETLGGPYSADTAAERAAAVPATRVVGDGESLPSAAAAEPGGLRSLAAMAVPGAASRRAPDETGLAAPRIVPADR